MANKWWWTSHFEQVWDQTSDQSTVQAGYYILEVNPNWYDSSY